jgi:hypothetical protein
MPFMRAPKDGAQEDDAGSLLCNQCQKVESHITFTPEKKVPGGSQASGEDLLADLYWNYKAFRRSPSF